MELIREAEFILMKRKNIFSEAHDAKVLTLIGADVSTALGLHGICASPLDVRDGEEAALHL